MGGRAFWLRGRYLSAFSKRSARWVGCHRASGMEMFSRFFLKRKCCRRSFLDPHRPIGMKSRRLVGQLTVVGKCSKYNQYIHFYCFPITPSAHPASSWPLSAFSIISDTPLLRTLKVLIASLSARHFSLSNPTNPRFPVRSVRGKLHLSSTNQGTLTPACEWYFHRIAVPLKSEHEQQRTYLLFLHQSSS